MNRTATINTLAMVFWLSVAGLIANHQLIAAGQVTLRWSNPTQANATWRWGSPPTLAHGRVVLAPGQSNIVRVTVPRAFKTGVLTMNASMERDGLLLLKASTLPGRPAAEVRLSDQRNESLNFHWADLATRGRQFDVRLTNSGQTDAVIQRLNVKITR